MPSGKILVTALLVIGWSGPVVADWPTYRFDNARSGATPHHAPASPQLAWTYRAPAAPRAAWDEPAIWDGWSKQHDLTNRQVFDKAIHVAVVEDRVYFGSSVDDTVYCVDLQSGVPLWKFYTAGPIRLAPCVVGERVFAGSDDGYVYCLDAQTGRLLWKHRPGPTARMIPGNGRIISPWAIRSGVVVVDDLVFCCAGVIPLEKVYVCALRVEDGQEAWKQTMEDLPAQGYLLASSARLYVMTARDRPLVFEANSGKRLYQVKAGTGGTYALLAGDTLIYGPSKTGQVNMVGAGRQDVLASFDGNHMIVSRPYSFLHARNELSALDRQTYVKQFGQRKMLLAQRSELTDAMKKATNANVDGLKQQLHALDQQIQGNTERLKNCIRWRTDCNCPFSLILAGETLIAGGDGQVVGLDASTGEQMWQRPVEGRAYGLAVASGKLLVSTDRGCIHCFGHTQQESDPAASESPLDLPAHWRNPLPKYGGPFATKELPVDGVIGPFAQFVAPRKIQIRWMTEQPSTSRLEFGPDLTKARSWTADEPKTQHEYTIDDVSSDTVYQYRVSGEFANGQGFESESYRFDSHFNYLPAQSQAQPPPFFSNALTTDSRAAAREILHMAGVSKGYALVLGASDGRLVYEIAKQSELQVVVVETEEQRAEEVREKMSQAGLLGVRVQVHVVTAGQLPFGPYLFNLITSEKLFNESQLPKFPLSNVYRCLRPVGGAIVLGHTADSAGRLQSWSAGLSDARSSNSQPSVDWQDVQGKSWHFRVLQRGRLPGARDWAHAYANPGNSACNHDERVRGDLLVQWWGAPGARPMPDRGNRNPPPVSSAGRLYIQGNRTLFGLDAYNGTILWSLQIPTMRRANMPRDSSNMVATPDQLLVAIGNHCIGFDGQSGQPRSIFRLPSTPTIRKYDWGYMAHIGETLLGSGVRRGSHYLGDKGEWYEGDGTDTIARVTSDYLFARNVHNGTPIWAYQRGVIINSTITASSDTIYFLESTSEAAQHAELGKLFEEVQHQQFLVALDLETGQVRWKRPYDFSQCQYMTYMTYGSGTLLVTGTDKAQVFHSYAFDAEVGEELWQHHAATQKKHHTGQLAHPTIVEDRVYFNKHTYDLRSGKILDLHNFDWHGCGIMSASRHTVFSRYEYHGMLDLATNRRTELLGLRSGCWLSLIPSGGLLLAPETSAGCSCGHALQTSIAFVPRSEVEPR